MNAQTLVPVFSGSLNNETLQLCDARKLHKALSVTTRFDTWFTRRVEEYGFQENQDFIANAQKRALGHGRGRTDYHITLDMAKELAMVERTDIGREVRRYFIRCEKIAHESQGSLKPYSVAPEQTLSAEEADMLRKLITEHAQTLTADQRADFIIKGWSKLKAHFGVSYRQIPQSQFTEAISILGRHMAELPAPTLKRQTVNELVADLTENLLSPDGYNYLTFMPLYHAIQKQIDKTCYMLVNRQHIVDLFNDLGKLRSRVDMLNQNRADHPDEWWRQKRIAG